MQDYTELYRKSTQG